MAEVEWAAEIAGLSEDIAGFPDRFEALVGERGITLSGGQKQRTAIARAVLREPKILILDDALSSVDTYTEEKILGAASRRDARSHERDRLASHLDRARRRHDLRAWMKGASSSRELTKSCWRSVASMRIYTNDSCSKKNWRQRKPFQPIADLKRSVQSMAIGIEMNMSTAVKQFHEEEAIGKTYDFQVARRLLRYLKPYVRLLVPALAAHARAESARRVAAEVHAVRDRLAHPAAQDSTGSMLLVGLFFGAQLLRLVFSYFQAILLNSVGQYVMFDMRNELYDKLQHQEVAYYDRNPVGRIMTRLTTDVDSLNELFTAGRD